MEKSFLQQLWEAVSALAIALIATFIPCAFFGVIGTLISTWAWNLDTFTTKLISWGLFTGTMFIYALVDRVTLRIYSKLTTHTYTYQTGRNLGFFDLIGTACYGWFSTDMRPTRPPRPRAYYYDS